MSVGDSVQIYGKETEQKSLIKRIRLDCSDIYVARPSLVIATEADRRERSILGGRVIPRGHGHLNKSAAAQALHVRAGKQVVPLTKACER